VIGFSGEKGFEVGGGFSEEEGEAGGEFVVKKPFGLSLFGARDGAGGAAEDGRHDVAP